MKKIILVLCLNIIVPSGPFLLILEAHKSFHKKRKANTPIVAQTILCTLMVSPFFVLRKRENEKKIMPLWWAIIILLFIIANSNRE